RTSSSTTSNDCRSKAARAASPSRSTVTRNPALLSASASMRWTFRSSSTTSTWTGSVGATLRLFLPRSLLEDTDVGRSHCRCDRPVLRQERTARVRTAVPQPPREEEQRAPTGREVLQRAPVHQALPVLHAPEEEVAVAELGGVLSPQPSAHGEGGQRVERPRPPDAREGRPVHQLEVLGRELHVD